MTLLGGGASLKLRPWPPRGVVDTIAKCTSGVRENTTEGKGTTAQQEVVEQKKSSARQGHYRPKKRPCPTQREERVAQRDFEGAREGVNEWVWGVNRRTADHHGIEERKRRSLGLRAQKKTQAVVSAMAFTPNSVDSAWCHVAAIAHGDEARRAEAPNVCMPLAQSIDVLEGRG
jgi:hypothetical protein